MTPVQHPTGLRLSVSTLFAQMVGAQATGTVAVWDTTRSIDHPAPGVELIVDRFHQPGEAMCAHLRLSSGTAAELTLILEGAYRLESSPLGGWFALPADRRATAYWIPCAPVLRRCDDQGHILAEQPAALTGFEANDRALAVSLATVPGWNLDWVCWRFAPQHPAVVELCSAPNALEVQPWFLWGSKVNVQLPAGLYRFLLHGFIYTDDFVWPRRWKFRSELDALGLFNGLAGLHLATGKTLYDLLRRQVVLSVQAAQSADGAWRHGEWTDLMEVHLRLHNAAMALLETTYEESADTGSLRALEKAAEFLSRQIDRTQLGAWFLHDTLETSAEYMEVMRAQTNTPWTPSRTLGKSPCTKLILNTHLDALVVLDRYQGLSGDARYRQLIDSARDAAQRILALHPAEGLYRLLYRVIDLSLLPKARAQALPLPLRAIKRLAWQVVQPNMHRFKRRWPRLVMPGGLIERHVAPLHYDINYHPVNVMDIVRTWRRFPTEDFATIVDNAIAAVERLDLLSYWGEAANRRFAVATWTEAMYHLCLLKPEHRYRQCLANAMLATARCGLGLPPALLGADAETTPLQLRRPCPTPDQPGLFIANLSTAARHELVLVNATDRPLSSDTVQHWPGTMRWQDPGGAPIDPTGFDIPPKRWVLGEVIQP